ncbi:hypothetical protein [Pelagibacterium sp. H642]|uniref:hypothetical protein n=1 Tax=Pelagibacterium sp. H642 TaxID=1881069 RepID=UPI002815424B|nr:hypothetical protein [Pelagibacterium sp. H642]WMT90589.1 hypothetical protein NO934_17720 [Pelagibacterium sp. H642]
MRLDAIALAIVIVFALLWLGVAITGMLSVVPFGVFGLVLIAVIFGLLAVVIHQRLNNAEDDHYDRTVDR